MVNSHFDIYILYSDTKTYLDGNDRVALAQSWQGQQYIPLFVVPNVYNILKLSGSASIAAFAMLMTGVVTEHRYTDRLLYLRSINMCWIGVMTGPKCRIMNISFFMRRVILEQEL